MILLTSTSDLIQLTTTSTATLDVVTTWANVDAAGAVTFGRQNTKVSTAATTTIIGSPAASSTRRVKLISITNTHATLTATVTLLHTDGTNANVLESITLLPSERLSYLEETGLRVIGVNGVPRDNTPFITGNANTADITANAADTYLAGGSLGNIAPRLQAGTFLKWRLRATKTAAGTATPIFNIRYGTAGAVGDTARATITAGAQTAATDTAFMEVDGIFRAAGASASLQMTLNMSHTGTTAGFQTSAQPQLLAAVSGATFDATPAASVIGLSVNPGTAGVWTFQAISVEINNLTPS